MVHTFTSLGIHVAVDVNSGAVHVIDKCAYDLLQLLEDKPLGPTCPDDVAEKLPYDRTLLNETWAELLELQQEGLLFSDIDYIDPQAAVSMQKDAPIKALCLHVSHDCNLRCKYCFASTGDFGTGHRINMDIPTAKAAIDFVIARSGSRRNIEVDFFGGEPLLAMDTVKATVEYARSIEKEAGKCFRFTITTNGMLLSDDNIEYINREMANCVLSLDGRPEVNDAMRMTPKDTGSYDIIVPKFKKLVDTRGDKDFYLRGTFTRNNLDFAADVLHMADKGFRSVSVEPAVGAADCDWAIREEDLPVVLEEYEKLAETLKDRKDVNFFHFNVDLAQGPCVIKRLRGCGAGCEYVAITPEGDIYPCHQFVGNLDYKMGNVHTDQFDLSIAREFAGLNIYTRDECKDCWARFYCSGGCSASNLQANGSIKKPNEVSCIMQRKRLECAIAMKAYAAGMGDSE